MQTRFVLLSTLLIFTLCPVIDAMQNPSPADVLLKVDQAFSDRAQEIGVPAAFLEFAAEDAVIYRNGSEPIIGKAAIDKAMAGDPEASLVWKPLVGSVLICVESLKGSNFLLTANCDYYGLLSKREEMFT